MLTCIKCGEKKTEKVPKGEKYHKWRMSIAGGSDHNGEWNYYASQSTTKKVFDKKIKGLIKGKKTIIKFRDLKTYYYTT